MRHKISFLCIFIVHRWRHWRQRSFESLAKDCSGLGFKWKSLQVNASIIHIEEIFTNNIGDMQLTKSEIAETQIIVTTPEKWDVVTRKPTGEGELASVRLLVLLSHHRNPNSETEAQVAHHRWSPPSEWGAWSSDWDYRCPDFATSRIKSNCHSNYWLECNPPELPRCGRFFEVSGF